MQVLSNRVAPLLVLAAIALGACGDQAKLTQPPQDPNRFVVCGPECGGGGGGGGSPPPPPPAAITSVTWPPATLYVIGDSVSYAVSLRGGPSTLTNVSVTSRLIQGSANLLTGSQLVSCGSSSGTLLATTTCSMSPSATVIAGGLGLVPGTATFEVDLNAGSTILSTQTRTVTIENASPQVTGINPGASPLLISGGGKSFTATLFNPFGSRPDMVQVWGFIRQGSQRFAVGSQPVSCGSGLGVLPSGSCTTSSTYTLAGTTLVPGQAVFEVELRNGNSLFLDSTSVNVMLTALPTMGTVTPAGAALVGVSPVGYTVAMQNPGGTLQNVVMHAIITQNGASRDAGTLAMSCGSGQGVVASGSSTCAGSFTASNTSAGSGTLTPGTATLQLTMSDPVNGLLAQQTGQITIAAPPTIDNGILNSSDLTIGGAPVGFTLVLSNPGPNLTNVTLKAVIIQPSHGAIRTAGTLQVNCGAGGLPNNVAGCTPSGQVVASNSSTGAGDVGTLVADGSAANLQFQLIDGNTGAVLATFTLSVNLK